MIYADYAAAAPLRPEARGAMLDALDAGLGNPSSIHAAGSRARARVEAAREEVAAVLGAHPLEIVFTSGATEANNLAITGVAPARRRRACHRACVGARAGAQWPGGPPRGVLPVDTDGRATLRRWPPPRPDLLTVALANAETGVVQPVAALAAPVRARGGRVHVDAAQAAAHLAIDVDTLGADLLTLSSAKVGGPLGTGALYVRARNAARAAPPRRTAGARAPRRHRERPAIVGFATALAIAAAERDREATRLTALTAQLRGRIALLGPTARCAPRGAVAVAPHVVKSRSRGSSARISSRRSTSRASPPRAAPRARPAPPSRRTCCWRWAGVAPTPRACCGSASAGRRPPADVDGVVAALARRARATTRYDTARGGRMAGRARRRRHERRRRQLGRRGAAARRRATTWSACRCSSRRHRRRDRARKGRAAARSRTSATRAASPSTSASRTTSGTCRTRFAPASSTTSPPSTCAAGRRTRACSATASSSSTSSGGAPRRSAPTSSRPATTRASSPTPTAASRLLRARDRAKDQSYFLFSLDAAAAGADAVPARRAHQGRGARDRARRLGLPVAEKPESQEICFVPDGDYAGFVERPHGRRASRPGRSSTRRARARAARRRASLHRRPAPRPRHRRRRRALGHPHRRRRPAPCTSDRKTRSPAAGSSPSRCAGRPARRRTTTPRSSRPHPPPARAGRGAAHAHRRGPRRGLVRRAGQRRHARTGGGLLSRRRGARRRLDRGGALTDGMARAPASRNASATTSGSHDLLETALTHRSLSRDPRRSATTRSSSSSATPCSSSPSATCS